MEKKITYSRYGEARHIDIINDNEIRITVGEGEAECVGIENIDSSERSAVNFIGGPEIRRKSMFVFSGMQFYIDRITANTDAGINTSFLLIGRMIKNNTFKNESRNNYTGGLPKWSPRR